MAQQHHHLDQRYHHHHRVVGVPLIINLLKVTSFIIVVQNLCNQSIPKHINAPFMSHCIFHKSSCKRSVPCWILSDSAVSLTLVFANNCHWTGVLDNISPVYISIDWAPQQYISPTPFQKTSSQCLLHVSVKSTHCIWGIWFQRQPILLMQGLVRLKSILLEIALFWDNAGSIKTYICLVTVDPVS